MQPTETRNTSIVALMAVFGLAICFVIVGAISVEYQAALNITNIGDLTLALFLTSAIVQLVIGPSVDRFGYKPVAIVGFFVAAVSMILLRGATSFEMAIGACILLGVGAMCLNTVGNTLIPVVLFGGKDPARASNFGNGFFGLGLVVTPLVFSLVNYRAGLVLLAALFLIGLVMVLATRFPAVSTGYQFSMAFGLLRHPAVIVAALALFCYIALEASMTTWSKPYMTELLGGAGDPSAVRNAGLVLSMFGVAMMIGRFATSAVKNLTTIGVPLIAGAALVAVGSILVMILTSSPILASAAVIVTGLVFAPIFPTIVGVTFAKFEPRLYGSIFGIIFALGLLGGTFVPQIIGRLSTGGTVQQSLQIVLGMAAALVVIALFLRVGARPASTAAPTR
ncbi:MAG TPA: MFS transporter [Vicinamibacterales bacterium]|nr:MFS transporter [Vicinamibacterales bacterium]